MRYKEIRKIVMNKKPLAIRAAFELIKNRSVPRLDPSAIAAIQHRKLRALVAHAEKNVPYYHRLFSEAGIRSQDINNFKDLASLPITTKTTLMQLPLEEITAQNIPLENCRMMLIAGPSGQPMRVYFTPRDATMHEAIWARSFMENGLRIRDRRLSIEYKLPFQSIIQRFGIWHKDLLSVELDPPSQVKVLERLHPDVLTGYPFDLETLAWAVKHRSGCSSPPRLVFSIGSYMSPAARKTVAAEFKGEVFDYFAWGELGCIGWECTEHQGYHINSDVFVVEIQKDGRPANPGEEGEVVCTSLHSTAMPLIRYATGDLAVQAAEPCPCGCGLPLMGERRGRANTFIIKTDGTWVSPCLLVNRLKVIPGIGQYKLLQLEKGKLDVRLMPAKGFGPEIQEKVLLVLKESLGKDMTVNIHIVDAIEPDPPGGIYSIHSDVSTEEQYFG